MSFTKGMGIVLRIGKNIPHKKIQISEYTLPVSKTKSFRSRIYSPAPEKNPELPVIYFQHGMGIQGIDDPRLVNMAQSLASAGTVVITPELPEIKNLEITHKSVDNIESVFRSLLDGGMGYEVPSIGYCSASFSVGMGLVAINRIDSPKIKGVFGIGGYCNFEKTIPYVLSNFDIDNYASLVYFLNAHKRLDSKFLKEKDRIFRELIIDNGLLRTGTSAKGPQLISQAPKAVQTYFQNVLTSHAFRMEFAKRIAKVTKPMEITRVSPVFHLENINCTVCLIHGIDDPVISPEESRNLHGELQKRNKDSHLLVSTVLTHGDTLPIYKQLAEFPKVSSLFARFIRSILGP